jgi:hypothetical protein
MESSRSGWTTYKVPVKRGEREREREGGTKGGMEVGKGGKGGWEGGTEGGEKKLEELDLHLNRNREISKVPMFPLPLFLDSRGKPKLTQDTP